MDDLRGSEGEVAVERWPFECRRSGKTRQVDYEVHRYVDAAGQQVLSWRRGGLPCPTPWSGISCPSCGGLRVQVLPPTTVPRTQPPAPAFRRD